MRQITLILLVICFSFCSISRAQTYFSNLDEENSHYRLSRRAVGPTVDVNGIRLSTLPYRSAVSLPPSNGPAITATTYSAPSYRTSTQPYRSAVSSRTSNGPAITATTSNAPSYQSSNYRYQNPSNERNVDVNGISLRTSSYGTSVSIPPSNGPAIQASTGYPAGGNSGYGRNSYVSSVNKNINGQRSSTVRVIDNGQDTVYRYNDYAQ